MNLYVFVGWMELLSHRTTIHTDRNVCVSLFSSLRRLFFSSTTLSKKLTVQRYVTIQSDRIWAVVPHRFRKNVYA